LHLGFHSRRAVILIVAILLAACAVTLTVLNRQERRSDEEAQRAQAQVAASLTRLLSWDADNLDAETQDEMGLLTDDFASVYEDLVRKNIAPAAKDGGLSASARIVGQGVVSLSDNKAVLLYFVNVKVSSSDHRNGTKDDHETEVGSRIKVVAVLDDGKWLISSYDPI
jgi:Mce-associated membrane protein